MSEAAKKALLNAYNDFVFAEESLCNSLDSINEEAERLKEHITSNRIAQEELSQHWLKTFGTEITKEVVKQEGQTNEYRT